MNHENVRTWTEADLWISETFPNLDQADAVASLVADALRQRGEISPQNYCAVWGNADYVTDATLSEVAVDKLLPMEREFIKWSVKNIAKQGLATDGIFLSTAECQVLSLAAVDLTGQKVDDFKAVKQRIQNEAVGL